MIPPCDFHLENHEIEHIYNAKVNHWGIPEKRCGVCSPEWRGRPGGSIPTPSVPTIFERAAAENMPQRLQRRSEFVLHREFAALNIGGPSTRSRQLFRPWQVQWGRYCDFYIYICITVEEYTYLDNTFMQISANR